MGLKCSRSHRNAHPWLPLKSDQDGIEIFLFVSFATHSAVVKIRPRWDWNASRMCVLQALLWVLKSDQDGIEIERIHGGYWGVISVKIRPRWDWNEHVSLALSIAGIQVKIRPRWDWNLIVSPLPLLYFFLLKSDQDGIEIRNSRWNRPRPSVLKSDQDGIEIRRGRTLLLCRLPC